MLRNWLIMLFVALAAIPSELLGKDKDYLGADAGYVVYSVGVVRLPSHFDFPYRRVATPDGNAVNDWKGFIAPKLGGAIYLKIKNPDFEGIETGQLVIRKVPPGRYEVQGFRFFGQIPGVASYSWSPAKPFALPFEIRAGEATYIGRYLRAPSFGTPLESVIGKTTFFVVADRLQLDMPIASGRLPTGMKISSEVTDVRQFDLPTLQPDLPPGIQTGLR